ncbi:hypothetical protein K432DRAFT_74718 [Lepidopterella palustris CBS 459.81]|uniref:Uncharacterized protein n=1 Tax=Lepidopterella palustris CBS 459.81 TaxID=1314670 RepID=A0A8E2E8C4_9PEZI|nr:hypothetical protein K432DRAFT_74718 [Lepidopterella palustris CBS 459.81]
MSHFRSAPSAPTSHLPSAALRSSSTNSAGLALKHSVAIHRRYQHQRLRNDVACEPRLRFPADTVLLASNGREWVR